ncbi:MAG: YdcF family protein, partial [Bradyrhizobiaceae bacterium]
RLLLSEYVKFLAAEARVRLANIGIDLMPDSGELPEPAPRKPVTSGN